jgi:hypothetical protein
VYVSSIPVLQLFFIFSRRNAPDPHYFHIDEAACSTSATRLSCTTPNQICPFSPLSTSCRTGGSPSPPRPPFRVPNPFPLNLLAPHPPIPSSPHCLSPFSSISISCFVSPKLSPSPFADNFPFQAHNEIVNAEIPFRHASNPKPQTRAQARPLFPCPSFQENAQKTHQNAPGFLPKRNILKRLRRKDVNLAPPVENDVFSG